MDHTKYHQCRGISCQFCGKYWNICHKDAHYMRCNGRLVPLIPLVYFAPWNCSPLSVLNAHMWSWHWVGCFWTLTYSGKCFNVESSLHFNFPVLRSNDFSVIAKHLLKSSILRVGQALSIWERCMWFLVGQWFIGSIHAFPIASWNSKWLYSGVNPRSSWYQWCIIQAFTFVTSNPHSESAHHHFWLRENLINR